MSIWGASRKYTRLLPTRKATERSQRHLRNSSRIAKESADEQRLRNKRIRFIRWSQSQLQSDRWNRMLAANLPIISATSRSSTKMIRCFLTWRSFKERQCSHSFKATKKRNMSSQGYPSPNQLHLRHSRNLRHWTVSTGEWRIWRQPSSFPRTANSCSYSTIASWNTSSSGKMLWGEGMKHCKALMLCNVRSSW